MHTLKLLTICALNEAGEKVFLNALHKVLASRNVPAKTGYWLNKITKVCVEENAAFETIRIAKIKELGKPVDDQPGKYHLDDEAASKLQSELKSLERDVELGIPAALMLQLPSTFTPEDWYPLMAALDIFEEPQ